MGRLAAWYHWITFVSSLRTGIRKAMKERDGRMNNQKHFLKSKINITAIIVAVMALGSIADKLPPQLSHFTPWITFAAMVATVIFRTGFTSTTLTTTSTPENPKPLE
jgi:hypothetical protein